VNANARGYVGGSSMAATSISSRTTTPLVLYSGVALRYDTQGTAFRRPPRRGRPRHLDRHGNAHGFQGGGFDGRYIYYVPSSQRHDPARRDRALRREVAELDADRLEPGLQLMRWLAALAMFGTGCAQLVSIDDTSGPGAELELERVSVGSTVMHEPLALQTAPTFVISDRSGVHTVTGTPGAAGVWTTVSVGATEVVYTAPDVPTPYQHALAVVATKLRASFVAFEHPDPQPAPPTSQLALDVQLPSVYGPGQTFKVIAGRRMDAARPRRAGATATGAARCRERFRTRRSPASPPARPPRLTHDDTVVVVPTTATCWRASSSCRRSIRAKPRTRWPVRC